MNLKQSHYRISSNNPKRPLLCPSPININETLEMRRATMDDKQEIIAFNALVHGNSVIYGRAIETAFGAINNAPNPTCDYNCITVVVDAMTGKIVSCCSSIPQIMIYGNENQREIVAGDGSDIDTSETCPRVPLIVVRPEAIGTLEEYRGQGLISAHLQVHNQWAKDLGATLQFIGGIPGYYHRFGYDNGIPKDIGHGGYMSNIESIKSKDYQFRLATTDVNDIDFIDRVSRVASLKRLSIWTEIDKVGWKNIIAGRLKGAFGYRPVFVIEKESTRIGFVMMSCLEEACVLQFEIDEPKNTNYASWTDVTFALLKWLPTFTLEYYLPVFAEQFPAKYEKKSKDRVHDGWSFQLDLGNDHPCLIAVPQSMIPKKSTSINNWKNHWYTRIADREAFLTAIKPVLNYRLQSSPFEAITKKLYISSAFRSKKSNILIDIVKGKISSISTVDESEEPILIQKELFSPIVLGTKTFIQTVHERGDVYSMSVLNAQIFQVLFPPMRNDQFLGMD
ncbi:hypothetical protein HDV04_005942 [Boothiomyces sp. JEL0838]|nr:hypothetical protein HDV04_005942 [Boothiomyces sp. JEL0838]